MEIPKSTERPDNVLSNPTSQNSSSRVLQKNDGRVSIGPEQSNAQKKVMQPYNQVLNQTLSDKIK